MMLAAMIPRCHLPAWQQVLLTALENVPKAKDGHDAWDRLTPEEQAGVMQFLGEQCGHDPEAAQTMLQETAGLVKPDKRRVWLWVLLGVAVAAGAAIWALHTLEERFGDLHGYVVILLCLSRLEQAWNITPIPRMVQVWTERTSTRTGTTAALLEMQQILSLPKKELRSKAALVWWSALLAIVIILMFV